MPHNQLFGPDPFCEEIKEPPLTWKVDILPMVANPRLLWSLAWQQLPTLVTSTIMAFVSGTVSK
jgi:hypothetical protein